MNLHPLKTAIFPSGIALRQESLSDLENLSKFKTESVCVSDIASFQSGETAGNCCTCTRYKNVNLISQQKKLGCKGHLSTCELNIHVLLQIGEVPAGLYPSIGPERMETLHQVYLNDHSRTCC